MLLHLQEDGRRTARLFRQSETSSMQHVESIDIVVSMTTGCAPHGCFRPKADIQSLSRGALDSFIAGGA